MRNNRSVQGITLNVILTITILISIVLTACVFMSIGQQQNVSSSNQQDQQSVTAFRPTNYIINDKDGTQNMVMHADNQQIKTMRGYLTSAEIKNPHKKKVSNATIISAISKKQSAVYRYPDVVPIDYFNARYNQHIATIKNFNFDYFVLSLDKSNLAYFINTQTKTMVTVSLSKINTAKMWELAEKLPKALTVNFKELNNRVRLNFPKEIKLPIYSYLVNHRDPTTYVSTLLGTTNQLKTTTSGNKVIYTNKFTDQQVTYDPDVDTVTFKDNKADSKLDKTYAARLNIGFSQINLLQLNLTDTRFYESRNDGKNVTYRTFVEGMPVYYQSESGAIHMTLDNHGNLISTYSLNELGVPVPNNQKEVTLPKTADILNRLKRAGVKESDYYFVTPGYEWLVNKDSHAAVNMSPTWMIETASGWQSVDDFLNARTKR
ncbi:hypothetical protein ACUIJP_01655 [Leuconostoc pseudomesenteroides]|uniref:hypothetical protein n=1 Tax=Leuconostoc pseudomesenteroides TaxID=33968 RepID=UPI00403DD704